MKYYWQEQNRSEERKILRGFAMQKAGYRTLTVQTITAAIAIIWCLSLTYSLTAHSVSTAMPGDR